MTSAEITQLRRVYGEICRGYSESEWDGKPAYIAHLTTFDQTEIDCLQDDAFREAVRRGITTEKERLKWLNKNGVWTDKDEQDLRGAEMFVDGLEKTLKKLALKVQIDAIKKQMAEGREKLDELTMRRIRAIGLTAERVAEQRVQLEYVRASFYADPDLRERVFSPEDLRRLDDVDSENLLRAYVDAVSRFSVSNVKRIAVQPFFINQFYLCGDDIKAFFGVPIVDLTIYQANLLSYGQYYRGIFSHNNVPKDVADDPDKIEEYVTRSANAKKLMHNATGEGGRVGIVGASREDFEAAGVEDGTQTMRNAAMKQYRDGRDAAKDMGYRVVDK